MSEPDNAPVRCMFLPLEQQGLLVPSTGVAEIIGFAPPRQVEGMPAWLTGYMSWRGVENSIDVNGSGTWSVDS